MNVEEKSFDLFKTWLQNFLETLFIVAVVAYMNSGIKFSIRKVLEITTVASIVLTIYDYYDEKSKTIIRSSLLMSLGNQLY
jgi:phosphate starvation-inducible membrane PsiE